MNPPGKSELWNNTIIPHKKSITNKLNTPYPIRFRISVRVFSLFDCIPCTNFQKKYTTAKPMMMTGSRDKSLPAAMMSSWIEGVTN
jgi:hypothetical protein